MATRKVDDQITDDEVRKYFHEINTLIETLKKWHKILIVKAKQKTISTEENELLQKVIETHNSLNSQFNELAPSLLVVALKSMSIAEEK